MKKLIIILITLCMIIPTSVFAEEYKFSNLKETLAEENITADLSDYKETEDQAIIYMFRGKGCSYCRSFLNFLNSIVKEYGTYFRLVSYEVLYEKENNTLMQEVASTLGKTVEGVPFIVIGDKIFDGYGASYDESIKSAIKEEYNNKNSNDVMKKLGKENQIKEESSNSSKAFSIIWNILIVISIAGIALYFHNEIAKVKEEIQQVENKISKNNKSKKEDK